MTALETPSLADPAPAAQLPRPRTILVGTAFGMAGALMYFVVLLGIYLDARADWIALGNDWIPSDADMQLTAPTVMAWTMMLSVVTMQWAVHAMARDDRVHAYLALGMTGLFGVAVINQTVFQYIQMGLRIDDITSGPAPVLIYTISGSHIVMIVVGLIFIALTGFRSMAGQSGHRYLDGVVAAAMFWYLTVFIYVVIWAAIFVRK